MTLRHAALLVALAFAAPAAGQSATLLELRNAASLARMVVDSGGMLQMNGLINSGPVPAGGGVGPLLLWYPGKAAFRAGFVPGPQWNNANIGLYSIAVGYATVASATFATALGNATNATATSSTALGEYTNASGTSSTAGGTATSATATASTAFGSGALATANYATSLGYATWASGTASFATGSTTAASGDRSTAMGYNTTASGPYSFASGNTTTASGDRSTSMGYQTIASGAYSTALGYYASTNSQTGSFVISDASLTTLFTATAQNQFSVRAVGGVRMFTNSALGAGATLSAGGSTWNAVSDRRRKEQFLPTDGELILSRIRAMPITTWRYLAEEDRRVRHIGPMAQDWRAAFGFSPDSTTINSGDFDGVNLAAAQALIGRTDRLRDENAALRAENSALRAAQQDVDARLARLEETLRRISVVP